MDENDTIIGPDWSLRVTSPCYCAVVLGLSDSVGWFLSAVMTKAQARQLAAILTKAAGDVHEETVHANKAGMSQKHEAAIRGLRDYCRAMARKDSLQPWQMMDWLERAAALDRLIEEMFDVPTSNP